MTLKQFVERESRANPDLADVFRAFETTLLECDSLLAQYGGTDTTADLVTDRDAPPRYWQAMLVTLDETRRISGLPPLGTRTDDDHGGLLHR